jgi:hypothetical protein
MSHEEALVAAALTAWSNQIREANKFFSALSDGQLMDPIAPNKNRAIYLLGHLTAVHDAMMPLFGFGARRHAELDAPFLFEGDNAEATFPSPTVLRGYWEEVNKVLDVAMKGLPASEWLGKHTAVSDEDFAKQPHRNRFSVLMSRTNHLAYHVGQLALAPKSA